VNVRLLMMSGEPPTFDNRTPPRGVVMLVQIGVGMNDTPLVQLVYTRGGVAAGAAAGARKKAKLDKTAERTQRRAVGLHVPLRETIGCMTPPSR
jgi:hypothetical protein